MDSGAREQRARAGIAARDRTLAQSTQLETAVCFGAPLKSNVGLFLV